MALVNDAHCHFFSTAFFAALGKGLKDAGPASPLRTVVPADAAIGRLGWDAPGSPEELADRWVSELDRAGVSRAALIASVPGDAGSVVTAVQRHPRRFVGFFMVDPTQPDAAATAATAIDRGGLRVVCLFPAMHRYAIQDERVRQLLELAAARPHTALFIHCGILTVGVRKKLGLPSPFDIRFGNPLDIHALALAYPTLPIIVPHFGAGMFREALMVADLCPNVLLDTSSSNGWIKYHPGLTLAGVFRQALSVVGPDRLLFGTDSSFFPRGWVADVFEQQTSALDEIGASADVRQKILGGNFDRVFPG
ncbi:MAG: amidohydrolase family protein [Vicinamibacterales bacterium]